MWYLVVLLLFEKVGLYNRNLSLKQKSDKLAFFLLFIWYLA